MHTVETMIDANFGTLYIVRTPDGCIKAYSECPVGDVHAADDGTEQFADVDAANDEAAAIEQYVSDDALAGADEPEIAMIPALDADTHDEDRGVYAEWQRKIVAEAEAEMSAAYEPLVEVE